MHRGHIGHHGNSVNYMLPAAHNACRHIRLVDTQVHAVHVYEHDNDIYGNPSYHISTYREIFNRKTKSPHELFTALAHRVYL